MTTSVLSARADNLSGHDLQVLRDYALNAPWEWRKALDALVEVAASASFAESVDHKKLKDKVAVMQKSADKSIRRIQKLRKHLPKKEAVELNAALADLEEALDV